MAKSVRNQVMAYIIGAHDLPDDCPYTVGDGTRGAIAVLENGEWSLMTVEEFDADFEWIGTP